MTAPLSAGDPLDTHYRADMLADSISPDGVRLTTFRLVYPRFIHSEMMTHRDKCLAGDVDLAFDLPAVSSSGGRRVHHMRLDEFVDKWQNGARRVGSKPKRRVDLGNVSDDREYVARELASMVGLVGGTNVNAACRSGEIEARKDGRDWVISGREFKRWRGTTPDENRYDMQCRLAGMNIRQLDEETGRIVTSRVVDARVSGKKEIFEVRAGDTMLPASADHRVMTQRGYVCVSDLVVGVDSLIVSRWGTIDKLDPIRLKKIDGKWRSVWQRKLVEGHIASGGRCERCGASDRLQAHHEVPVHKDLSRAFDCDNVLIVCGDCHDFEHRVQGWQRSNYLYGDTALVESVTMRGVEPAYDLEIEGPFPNFTANGVVVHNSRNAASSRAIPTERLIEQVRRDPFVPATFNKRVVGMGVGSEFNPEDADYAKRTWTLAANLAANSADVLMKIGLDKSRANRILEPFLWYTAIFSGTEWDNMLALRDHPAAQPEIQAVARCIKRCFVASTPTPLDYGQWHLPLVDWDADMWRLCDERSQDGIPVDEAIDLLKKISASRCARVSYDRTDDESMEKTIERADFLMNNGHFSPFEHVARPIQRSDVDDAVIANKISMTIRAHEVVDLDPTVMTCGNLRGWVQMRKAIPNEDRFDLAIKDHTA